MHVNFGALVENNTLMIWYTLSTSTVVSQQTKVISLHCMLLNLWFLKSSCICCYCAYLAVIKLAECMFTEKSCCMVFSVNLIDDFSCSFGFAMSLRLKLIAVFAVLLAAPYWVVGSSVEKKSYQPQSRNM